MSEGLTREAELALLIAEQEADAKSTTIWKREVSLDAAIGEDENLDLHDVVGVEDSDLLELLGENDTWIALVKQRSATDGDMRFWRYLHQRQGWSYAKIATHVGANWHTVAKYLGKPKRRGSEQARALAQKLPAARIAYESGAKLHEIAEELYVAAGYASAESCYQRLRKLFHDKGIAVRPGSWKHGRRSRAAPRDIYIAYWREQNRKAGERRRAQLRKCSALTREAKPCSRWARQGTDLCNVHAGLTGGPTVWTKAVVCRSLREWAAEQGRAPSPRDWTHAAVEHPNFKTVYNLFGSWPDALRAAFREDGELAA